LTSFAGLHFENEPGLTELYAAEGRQNRRFCVSKRGQRRKHYSDVIGQAKNRLCELVQYGMYFCRIFFAKIDFFASLDSVGLRLSENEGVQIFQPLPLFGGLFPFWTP